MYMKKLSRVIMPVIKGFVLCAVAIQIVLGVVYIGSNFMVVPQFRETAVYLEMTEKFVADEYIGILYPLLVRLCSVISFIPYQIPIYLIQIITGIFCVYHFVCTWTHKMGIAIVCALWVNTLPFIAQAHVTVLPHSLAFSFLVLMLLEVLKGTAHRQALGFADWAVLLCSYTILVQISREYLWAGSLLVVWAVFLQLYTGSKKVLMFIIGLLICLGMFLSNVAIYKITQTQGYYGRIQRSFEAAFFQRVGMSTMTDRFMIYMPEEIGESFSGEELEEFAKYPYQLQTVFGPTLEARYGKEYANELYWELGMLGLRNATLDNITNIAEDTMNYAWPMGMYFTWRDGDLKGITSWNYQQFMEQAQEISVIYAKVCHFWWLIGFGVSVTIGILTALRKRKLNIRFWLPMLVYVAAYALYFALAGEGLYDYKLALLPMAISCIPVCWLLVCKSFEE